MQQITNKCIAKQIISLKYQKKKFKQICKAINKSNGNEPNELL